MRPPTVMSFVFRAAFDDLGDKTSLKEMQAFILLRQSSLSVEDKKKVLSMTNGNLQVKTVEQAMRTLSTKVLLSNGEPKKKIYPTNFVEPEEVPKHQEVEPPFHSTYHVMSEEEEALTTEILDQMANNGDEDALVVQQFERDLEDMMQEVPDLQAALVSYQEARQRISERRRSRGFWPSKSRGKGGGRDFFAGRGGRKGGHRGGKEELLARISRTHCKICGMVGHWKAECPQKKDSNKETVNVVHEDEDEFHHPDLPQVIFENVEHTEAGSSKIEVSYVVHSHSRTASESIRISDSASQQAIQFLKSRMSKYKLGNKRDNGVKYSGIHAQSAKGFCKPMPRSQPIPEKPSRDGTPDAECLSSQLHDRRVKMSGLAILDTGASRSVIGAENVPLVLQKLPAATRAQVREVPSKVGFRFGNNQIEYSFKQLQIPLMHGSQRIWLLVEVVPKATPFLLSIKTMKSLGATIDLGSSQCHLKKLNRSLVLQENNNGLFVIDISDLCEDAKSETAAAFVTSSSPISAPPGLEIPDQPQHADASGDPRGSEVSLRGSDRKPESAVLHDLLSHQGDQPEREHVRPGCDTNPAIGERSQDTAHEDHGAGKPDHAEVSGPADEIQWTYVTNSRARNRFRPMGTCRDGGGRVHPTKRLCWNDAKYFPTEGFDQSSNDGGDSKPWFSHENRRNAFDWSPCQSDVQTSTDASRPRKSDRPDSASSSQLGPKSDQLGKEASRQDFPDRLRDRQLLCAMGSRPHGQHERRRDGRFRKLCPDQTTSGSRCTERQPVAGAWQPIPESRVHLAQHDTLITSPEEAMWLKEVYKLINKGNNQCPQLDLLEVYAHSNSKLTEVANACGLKARRFTFEDGDLSTAEGRNNLLLQVMLYRPKHLWLPPECKPWRAWNRFNAARSVFGFRRVQQIQQQSLVHLKLCNLLAKIQSSEGRHTHLEQPWRSEAWNQNELSEFLRMSIAAKLDQCMFGLQHPTSQEPMQKKTRVQTTSREMFQQLDQRLCNHQHSHARIEGTCHWRNQTMQLSQFASHYPRVFAKAIVKGIIKGKEGPIEQPVYHVHDETPEDMQPPQKKQKVEDEETPDVNMEHEHTSWQNIMEQFRCELPKSGVKTWTNPMHQLFRSV